MLAKKRRLPVGGCIGRFGRAIREEAYTVKIFPAERPWSRFGVVCGKNADSTAAGRNRIRRIVMDAAGKAGTALPLADYLVIIHPRKGGYPKSYWHEFHFQIPAR